MYVLYFILSSFIIMFPSFIFYKQTYYSFRIFYYLWLCGSWFPCLLCMLTFPPMEAPSFLQFIPFYCELVHFRVTDLFINMRVFYVLGCERAPLGGFACTSAVTRGVSPAQHVCVNFQMSRDDTLGRLPHLGCRLGLQFHTSDSAHQSSRKPVHQPPTPQLFPGLHLTWTHLNYMPLDNFFNTVEAYFLPTYLKVYKVILVYGLLFWHVFQ